MVRRSCSRSLFPSQQPTATSRSPRRAPSLQSIVAPSPAANAANAIVVTQSRPREVSLNDSRILRSLFAFLVLAILAVAHVTLQFATLDMKVQHRQLQERTRVLRQEVQRLETRERALADEARIRDTVRRSLRLQETGTERPRVMASVPQALRTKYAPRSAGAADESELPSGLESSTADKGDRSLASTLVSFIDVGRASAAVEFGQ